MKKQYTEMITSLHKMHKRTGLSHNEIHDAMIKELDGKPDRHSTLRRCIGEFELIYEQTDYFRHVFLPDLPFCEWLADCAKVLEPELADKIVEGLGSTFVCLHFPTSCKKASALFWFGTKADAEASGQNRQGHVVFDFSMDAPWGGGGCDTRFNYQAADARMTGGYLRDGSNEPEMQANARTEAAEWYMRLVAGLGLYMSCFPEQVREGIPEDAKRADYARSNAKTIGVSESVVCRDGPTPHYRSGHFRLLSSDRYVNKKGQVVFIHGTFVKGQAKTVLAPN